jgi:hypothetical protein
MPEWDRTEDWFWEGNIQQKIIDFLNSMEGYKIIRICDPKTKGPDILVERHGILRQIEVKGYPSEKYVAGPSEGQKKPTNPRLQAKHWFGEALLALLIAKSNNTELEISLGLPKKQIYIDLLNDTSWARRIMGISCYIVDESGDVYLFTE